MPRTRAAASWVSPSTRRRRRNADLMQACASSLRRIGVSGNSGLNSRAPIAAPERAAFERYADDRGPLKVAICDELLHIYHNSNKVLSNADTRGLADRRLSIYKILTKLSIMWCYISTPWRSLDD